MIWKKRYGGGAKEKYLISLHEYALIYAKNESSLENIYIPLTEESIKRYYIQKDKNFTLRGAYRTHPLEATKSMGERQNLVFDIPAPDGTMIAPKRQWLWSKERVNDAITNNEIEFIRDKSGGWSVHTKQYLKDEFGNIRQGKAFSLIDDVYTQHGTNEIIDLFGNAQAFSFPKPTVFIKKLLQIGLNGSKQAIVLDFFSGSATTAHAVMQLNAEDASSGSAEAGKRRFIMVQLPEVCDEKSEAYKAGYKTIAEIGKERIRRAGLKIKDELGRMKDEKKQDSSSFSFPPSSLDIGFRVLKIDSSNMKDVYYTPDAVQQTHLFDQVDNIREDRTAEDLLFQVLLDWGVDLTLPITQETIKIKDEGEKLKDEERRESSSFIPQPSSFKEYQVFFVDDNALAACFDTDINEAFVKELAARHPLRVVFRDAGFVSDSVKINIEQIFKLISPTTEIKTL